MSRPHRATLARVAFVAALAALALAALPPAGPAPARAQAADGLGERRLRMVEDQIQARGVRQPEILKAMTEVPRHLFVPDDLRDQAYDDKPLPIDFGQTISQPYMVALMTELLDLSGEERVLEIGTGSGYHSAVLSRVADEVYTIEILEPLAHRAAVRLRSLGFANVRVRAGDGYGGWPAYAPFDAIILTAAPQKIPPPLIDQLKVGGRMVVPVGDVLQDLRLLVKNRDGSVTTKRIAPVRFVPMTGEAQNEAERP
jgi:protein-L-isoaspartate(D-aspartate) O-methyltransferase